MSSAADDNQWIYRKEDLYRTPSAQNNISYREEKESRSKGVLFIITVGMHLKLPQLTMATAAVFFHRFYMRHSLMKYKFYDVGATCLYLASKTEESTRKFKDVIVACAQKAAKKDVPFDDTSKEYRIWKDTIVYTEEVLLEALCFELTVEHPYHHLLTLFENHFQKDQHLGRKLKQVAWAFLNDSLRTTLCLTFSPKIIAIAAIYVAGKYLEENMTDCFGDVWRELYEPDVTDIQDAANEILDQYIINSRSGRSYDKILPGSKPGSEYQENNTPAYAGYLNSPAKLTTPAYNTDTPTNGDRSQP
ncbi:hypothetical protein BG004_007197 [Podila humilis]|nr:hypothetical protein BG004_007197 [Podila humilis]